MKNYDKYINLLFENKLFFNIKKEEIKNILNCFDASIKAYEKKEVIIEEGSLVSEIGIILSGQIQISKTDIYGNVNIISEFFKNHIFAERITASEMEESPVRVVAQEKTEILFIKYNKITQICGNCNFHSQIIKNMMKIIALRNNELNKKIDIISRKTIREKLLTYFQFEMRKQGRSDNKIKLSFTKTDLADYICADRSALSRELGRMKNDGIIDISRNTIILKNIN